MDKIPALPQNILPWSEEEKLNYIYKPDSTLTEMENMEHRIRLKLAHIWGLYSNILQNPELEDLMLKKGTGRLLNLQTFMVQLMDAFGKILSSSNLLEELEYLKSNALVRAGSDLPVDATSVERPSDDPIETQSAFGGSSTTGIQENNSHTPQCSELGCP